MVSPKITSGWYEWQAAEATDRSIGQREGASRVHSGVVGLDYGSKLSVQDTAARAKRRQCRFIAREPLKSESQMETDEVD